MNINKVTTFDYNSMDANSDPNLIKLYENVVDTLRDANKSKENTWHLIKILCEQEKTFMKPIREYTFNKKIENEEIEFEKIVYRKGEIESDPLFFRRFLCDEIMYQLQENQNTKKILCRYLQNGKQITSSSQISTSFVNQFFSELEVYPADLRRMVLLCRIPGESLIKLTTTLFYRAKEKLGNHEKTELALLLFCLILVFNQISETDFAPYTILESFAKTLDVEKIELWFIDQINFLISESDPLKPMTQEEAMLWHVQRTKVDALLKKAIYPLSNDPFIEEYRLESPLINLMYASMLYRTRVEDLRAKRRAEHNDNSKLTLRGKLAIKLPLFLSYSKKYGSKYDKTVKTFDLEKSLHSFFDQSWIELGKNQLLLMIVLNEEGKMDDAELNMGFKELFPEWSDSEIEDCARYASKKMKFPNKY